MQLHLFAVEEVKLFSDRGLAKSSKPSKAQPRDAEGDLMQHGGRTPTSTLPYQRWSPKVL